MILIKKTIFSNISGLGLLVTENNRQTIACLGQIRAKLYTLTLSLFRAESCKKLYPVHWRVPVWSLGTSYMINYYVPVRDVPLTKEPVDSGYEITEIDLQGTPGFNCSTVRRFHYLSTKCSLSMAGCTEKKSTDEEMRIVWSWFSCWTDHQKYEFMDVLASKVTPSKVCSLYGAMESLSLASPDVFHCQLRMFNTWFSHWTDQERNLFVNGLEERDYQSVQYFYEKVSQTAHQE